MLQVILGLLTAGLSLWSDKEKHKYIDKKIALEKAWYVEINRPEAERNQAALDDIEFEIRTLAIAFSSAAAQAPAAPGA